MAKTKNIKVRDLKPSKDAKGGGATRNSHGIEGATRNTHGLEGGTHQGSTKNTKQHLGAHGGGHT
jgi:hypothetical protein